MSSSEVKREITAREKFLKKNKGLRGFEKSFSAIQKFLYGKGEL